MSYTVAYNVSGKWRYLAEGYDGPGSIWRADIRYFDTIEEAREKAEQLKNEYSRTNRSVKVRILDAWDNDVDTDEHVDIYNASTKKSKMKKSSGLDRVLNDLMNISDAEASAVDDACATYSGEYQLDFENLCGFIQLASDYADGKRASTKKSKPDTRMSFEDNVNKMRTHNYARTGNINTVMKKRE